MRRADGQNVSRRVNQLKKILFDLVYLMMYADGIEHISEKMLLEKLERKIQTEDSVDIQTRVEVLSPVVEAGPAAIHEEVERRADAFLEQAGDKAPELAGPFLDLIRGLIVADATITPEEHEFFRVLADRWEVDQQL